MGYLTFFFCQIHSLFHNSRTLWQKEKTFLNKLKRLQNPSFLMFIFLAKFNINQSFVCSKRKKKLAWQTEWFQNPSESFDDAFFKINSTKVLVFVPTFQLSSELTKVDGFPDDNELAIILFILLKRINSNSYRHSRFFYESIVNM